MNVKKWAIAPLDKERAAQIAERHSIPFFLAMMLDIRGIRSDEEIDDLLRGTGELSDPYLMKDMDKAVARIRRAVDGFEKIAVYGDYDADGVTATAILYTYLETVGADVCYYIPQREGEGYGMNCSAVRTLHDQGVKLIVTVDNGISSVEEVSLANRLGVDVVVTDHHRPHEQLPDAAAVVDAYRDDDESPFKDLCGAGVALKLLIALEDGDAESILEEYADLAALGTIGDVVSLTGENRLIVQVGLRSIVQGGRPSISALLGSDGSRQITAGDLAFTAIPRINATGRMGSPERAVRLLCSEDEDEAQALAEEINEENLLRRQVQAQISEEAMAMIENDPKLQFSRVIVVCGDGWHHGVIGNVASKVTERYGKPCYVISRDGESAKGSGRSVEGFSLFDATFSCARLLERFGGHPMAAGLTIRSEHIDEFREAINAYAKKVCPEMPAMAVQLDCRLNPAAVSVTMPRDLQALEPFGAGNPKPMFGLFGMELREITPVGGGKHLRLTFRKSGSFITAMQFGLGPEDFPFAVGSRVDLAVQLELREFRGKQELTICIQDIRLAGISDEEYIHTWRLYEKLCRRETLTAAEAGELTPSREELAALYRRLMALGGRPCSVQTLLEALSEQRVTLGKLFVCLDILEERGLIVPDGRQAVMHIRVPKQEQKVDIFASRVLADLKTLTEREVR